jgi:hypothetical protein
LVYSGFFSKVACLALPCLALSFFDFGLFCFMKCMKHYEVGAVHHVDSYLAIYLSIYLSMYLYIYLTAAAADAVVALRIFVFAFFFHTLSLHQK